ncbi:MAG: dihydropteroate synthase [Actinobacteria bacterium]|nr:dihydropteroate synthase [Actinomycetota bacterium]
MSHPQGLPDHLAALSRTLVMGVVNVTPDSFSDGGKFDTETSAVKHGLALANDGADIVDVGGESTRPGAQRVTLEEELNRVIPVVTELVANSVVVSVDTMRAEVAKQAIAAGAYIINDVSGGQADPEMFKIIAEERTPYIMMHWRGHSAHMIEQANYVDVVNEVKAELAMQLAKAIEAGISTDRIVLDPGLGFAKMPEQNWPLLKHISKFSELGCPLLVGASRKRFLGELLATQGQLRDVADRESATTALTTLLASQGVWAVRVHDVIAARDAIAVVEKLKEQQ